MNYIDLRSDTVTKPSSAMREAMMKAEVGDDVFSEDPTVTMLQERIANMFGKEAALFVPSGTMGNEVCIKAHTEAGDEIIVEQDSHIFVYETAAPALLSGVQMQPLIGSNGLFSVEQLKRAVRPKAYYMPPTKLICLENTHGRSGGSVLPIDGLKNIYDFSREAKLKMHLDGARLWNAAVASGVSFEELARYTDSLSVCFSKGLGAPVGSMIIGDRDFVERSRRFRKIFGGGMRQVGILAAAALFALDHNISRLKDDHHKAKFFAEGIANIKQFQINTKEVYTNMVIVGIESSGKSQADILTLLKSRGILMTPEKHSSIRAVMHLDVSMDDVVHAISVIHSLFA